MEMLQNASNCYKSERSRNKNNLPSFFSLLYWSLFEGKQFDTAPHLKFDKFHHNKRIALKLKRCILGSLAYLCFSYILTRRKPLLNTKLAFPGMRFHLTCTRESLRANAESREVGLTGNRELSERP